MNWIYLLNKKYYSEKKMASCLNRETMPVTTLVSVYTKNKCMYECIHIYISMKGCAIY